MAEGQIPEPQFVQYLDLLAHGGLSREEGHAFLHRHVEHVGDGLAAPGDFQRFGAEARSFAHCARHFDIGHEIELRGDDAFALALLAAAALDVEAKAARFVAALHGNGRAREELADGVVKADISRGVRAAVAADRRLVDVDHLVYVLCAIERVVIARQRPRVHQALPQGLE